MVYTGHHSRCLSETIIETVTTVNTSHGSCNRKVYCQAVVCMFLMVLWVVNPDSWFWQLSGKELYLVWWWWWWCGRGKEHERNVSLKWDEVQGLLTLVPTNTTNWLYNLSQAISLFWAPVPFSKHKMVELKMKEIFGAMQLIQIIKEKI